MVDVARYFMEFCMTESCGKCIPCRVGTVQMHELLKQFSQGTATAADLEQLEELCDMVSAHQPVRARPGGANPVLSTLRYFRDEYLRPRSRRPLDECRNRPMATPNPRSPDARAHGARRPGAYAHDRRTRRGRRARTRRCSRWPASTASHPRRSAISTG